MKNNIKLIGIIALVAVSVFGVTVCATSANGSYVSASSTVSAGGIEMVWVPGGSFTMGYNPSGNSYIPIHPVTLTGFYMGKYEITQEQYEAVMGNNPSYYNSNPALGEVQNRRPVECVSWYDAIVFCNRLSIRGGLSPAYSINGSTNPDDWGSVPVGRIGTSFQSWGDVPASSYSIWDAVTIVAGSNGYRLPTEAQWEYAAKGGDGSPGNYIYAGSNNIDDVAWYAMNSGIMTHEVGKKAPNGLGLYDMSGNVEEWCWDWYGVYTSSAKTDPTGAVSGSYRVQRGQCFRDGIIFSSAYRGSYGPGSRLAYSDERNSHNRFNELGFRVVHPE